MQSPCTQYIFLGFKSLLLREIMDMELLYADIKPL